MKRFSILFALLFVIMTSALGQVTGTYYNKQYHIRLKLDVENKMPIPGLEADSCRGHLQGNLNGTWVILKIKEHDDKHAVVRAMSDRGGDDAQDIELTLNDDATAITLKQVGGSSIKTIENRKYVKLPKNVTLNRE